MASATLAVPLAGQSAAASVTFSGEGIALSLSFVDTSLVIADSGSLPADGGNLSATVASVNHPGLTASSASATAIGGGNQSQSTASITNPVLEVFNPDDFDAGTVQSTATATCTNGVAAVSGSATVTALHVFGRSITVTGVPNQNVDLGNGNDVIIDEQVASANGIEVVAVNFFVATFGSVAFGISLAGVDCPSGTSTSLTANPVGSAGFGHPATFTATVAPTGSGSPTGPVTFSVDGTPVQTVDLNGSDQASVTTSSLSPGSHVIGANYQGDTNFIGSSTTTNYPVTCSNNVANHNGAVAASGDSTCVVGSAVTGSVQATKGTSLALVGATVSGSIVASGPGSVELCGSHVGGSVTVINAKGPVIIGDPGDAACAPNTITGSLVLEGNTNGVEAIDNTVATVVASGNSGPGPFPGDVTTITGNHR